MKILITGAAGFIGSHTAERLSEMNHEVVAIDNFSEYYSKDIKLANTSSFKKKGIFFITADLRKPSDLKEFPTDFDYIIHFAAQPGISRSAHFEDYLTNNVVATGQLAAFAVGCKNLRLFINISTSSVYGSDATKSEEYVPMPISPYGITKLTAEQIVLSYTRNSIYKACSLRLYSVYGPRERPDKLYTKLIECGLNDRPFPLYEGSLEHTRSFTYVEDIVKGIIAAIGKDDYLANQVINLGSENEHTTAEGIATVESLLGKKINIELQPARPGDQSRTKAVIDKAKNMLNYTADTSLREGIQKQIAWFQDFYETITISK